MQNYKDPNNQVHVLDSDEYEYLLPSGCVKITQDEADSLLNPPESPEQIIARLESALDRHLDTVANQRRYESIRTMVTYSTSEHHVFGPEGRAAIKFRDAVYQKGLDVLSAVQAGTREIPTEEDFIKLLPKFEDFL